MSTPFSPEATVAQSLLPCERDQELLLPPAWAVAEWRGREIKSLGDGLWWPSRARATPSSGRQPCSGT